MILLIPIILLSFKNSLIITPNYEIEFNGTGGVKYIKNHDDCVFFTGGGIFARTNNIQKIPVLLKREINKLSSQKKLIVEEKYNYEEKYEVHQNIIIYYEENRIDFQVLFNKSISNANNTNSKDITSEFTLNLAVPMISDAVTYKKYSEKQEHKNLFSKLSNSSDSSNSNDISDISDSEFDKDSPILDNVEYIIVKCGKSDDLYMTIYPERTQILKYKNKSLGFSVPVLPILPIPPILPEDKLCINLKIYLEKYRIT